jgi:enoyl-CoA hydratase
VTHASFFCCARAINLEIFGVGASIVWIKQIGDGGSMSVGRSETGKGTITLRREGRVARLGISSPAKRNAISLSMWEAFRGHLRDIAGDPGLAVVLVEGAGTESFASGADISELEACLGSEPKGRVYMEAVEAASEAISSCELPVVAAIRGYCIGAGLEVAMACDIRFATRDSLFSAAPAKMGANYSYSSTLRLVRLVGPARAKDILYSGRRLAATEAAEIGLVNVVAGRDRFDTELHEYIETLLANSQYSIRVAKRTLDEVARGVVLESETVRSLRARGFSHPDLREGVSAFRERRRPIFSK